MERELDRRRGWPWKNRKNISLSGSIDGSPSAPVKLFDEQVCIDLHFFLPTQIFSGLCNKDDMHFVL